MFDWLRLMPPYYMFRSPVGANYVSSGIDLLSYRQVAGEWNLGFDGLVKRRFNENPLVPGGVLAAETAGVRRLEIPLLLASTGTFNGLLGLEDHIRRFAVPGAFLDYRTKPLASQPLMRIDILGGELVPKWNERLAENSRREALLKLDVQPFAYPASSPFLLASTGSMALPGSLQLASTPGDYPALLRIRVSPVLATSFMAGGAGVWQIDALGWTNFTDIPVAANERAGAFIGPAVLFLADVIPGTVIHDDYAPVSGEASQSIIRSFISTQGVASGWQRLVRGDPFESFMGPGDTRGWVGRFRLWAYMRLGPSQGQPWQITADVVNSDAVGHALASAAPIATLAPAVASGSPGGWGAQPSPAFQIIDLGEITLPAQIASYQSGAKSAIRIWAAPASANAQAVGVPTTTIDFAGVFFQPLDLTSGMLARGLVSPSHVGGNPKDLEIDARGRTVAHWLGNGSYVGDDILAHYRGDFPMNQTWTKEAPNELAIFAAARKNATGATGPLVHAGHMRAAVSVHYTPRFNFLGHGTF